MPRHPFSCCGHCKCVPGLRVGHDVECPHEWCPASRPDAGDVDGQIRLGGST